MKPTLNPGIRSISLDQQGVQKPSESKGDKKLFADLLSNVDGIQKKEQPELKKPFSFEFSRHAVDRMQQRGIFFSPDQMNRIEDGLNKATEKGAKETLVFMDDVALILSVKDKKVVTVMDQDSLKNNVFTQIDSTVVV